MPCFVMLTRLSHNGIRFPKNLVDLESHTPKSSRGSRVGLL